MVGGFGGCSLDKISLITRWPEQEEVSYINERLKVPGGMTLNGIIAAARLGVATSYLGAVGKDEDGDFILNYLKERGVQTQSCHILDDGPTPLSLVMTGPDGKRTIFHQKGIRDCDYHPALKPDLTGIDVLLMDGSWMENTLEWAEKASALKIPIVLDLSPNNTHPLRERLLQLADYPVLSYSLAQKITTMNKEDAQVTALQEEFGGTCVVTNGAKGLWYADGSKTVHLPSIPVEVVDTTGAGDTFHGALAAALSLKQPLEAALTTAMATAALKCTGKGHEALPDLKKTEAFISENRTS